MFVSLFIDFNHKVKIFLELSGIFSNVLFLDIQMIYWLFVQNTDYDEDKSWSDIQHFKYM